MFIDAFRQNQGWMEQRYDEAPSFPQLSRTIRICTLIWIRSVADAARCRRVRSGDAQAFAGRRLLLADAFVRGAGLQ
jgi:hypothetical protein